MNNYLNIDHVSITFPTDNGPLNVLNDVDLKVSQGEFISLIGHSGCGKSTVLNIVAGLLNATEGGVILEEKEVTEPGPDRAVVFQNHSLLPWLTVYDNVRLAVDQVFKKSKSKEERHRWTLHNLELVHMSHALDRKPDEISGGMKQRVGIARALAMEPKVLLMDEPFGALDSLTRTHMQDSLMEIQARLNNTVIMITHDVDEAVLLSDRIIMMTNGPSATIGEILNIDLPKPRNRLALAENPVYNHYRAEVVRFLHERHQQPEEEKSQPQAEVESDTVVDLSAWLKSSQSASGKTLEKDHLTLGFIPLTDCAPLVVAKEKGFFHQQGLNVELSRENSWANIRDKVGIGMLDGAQMLAAMPLASALGVSGSVPMITGMSLDLNGNGITVSKDIHQRMVASGESDLDSLAGSGRALKKVIEENRAAGGKPLMFATVFPYSSHNYLLRYWLAASGIDPDNDIQLTVVPPPQMVNYLQAGVISGFCVGEPWNTLAVCNGLGHTLAASYDIWNNHPEKVFGVASSWAAANPNTHQAVITALIKACEWIDQAENRKEVCELLSQGRYVNAPQEILEKSMLGTFQFSRDEAAVERADFNVFNRYNANFPWRSHAIWFLTQMVRWGQLRDPFDMQRIAKLVYQPEIYRKAAASLSIDLPQSDIKSEGIHGEAWQLAGEQQNLTMGSDLFFDGKAFDPQQPIDYLTEQPVSSLGCSIEALLQANPSKRSLSPDTEPLTEEASQ
ncbi:MAG: nitrate ABC transporter ATP-binding protein [Candidatus Thiodiazotropha taylori]|nr:nitrate ABC transporter ATP-binding protein [Candidatus Thiodiazotropha endolucinida]MCG7967314.1 nitrate ABC transporter ATP-binding protein [Candidatus Thiodiazotropha taylori]MCG8040513.1 nitrate ABC transporter ATP-binding protein [Candidatus Thiodiazotropha taylori]MCW4229861.1 nitrate ABC transporter ATP-binding protein [Candidatus Thiodiazotropha taylori]MCW4320793.1 nitrate ABC transporter ATP-binding protein [Candidatus Thiodiazotropha taylori]